MINVTGDYTCKIDAQSRYSKLTATTWTVYLLLNITMAVTGFVNFKNLQEPNLK